MTACACAFFNTGGVTEKGPWRGKGAQRRAHGRVRKPREGVRGPRERGKGKKDA